MRLQVISAVTALAAAVALALTATSFGAHGTPCNASTVFAAWGDTANYVAMTPVGGARASSVVVGPAVSYRGSCIGLHKAEYRLIAQNAGNASSTLTVSARFQDATGWHSETIGMLTGYAQSAPSPILRLHASGLRGNVTLTLSASDSDARWLVSGVYADPYKYR
jgi:hypothetical protein